jgi:hypothetical protein
MTEGFILLQKVALQYFCVGAMPPPPSVSLPSHRFPVSSSVVKCALTLALISCVSYYLLMCPLYAFPTHRQMYMAACLYFRIVLQARAAPPTTRRCLAHQNC